MYGARQGPRNFRNHAVKKLGALQFRALLTSPAIFQIDTKHFPFKVVSKGGKPYVQVANKGEQGIRDMS